MIPYLEIFHKQIPTYGICLLLGITAAFLLCVQSAKKYGYHYYDLLIVGAFALSIALPAGSLLYTIVTYSFQEILHFLSQGNFRIFGGLIFYGAFIGGILGGILGIRAAKMDFCAAEKIIVPYIPIGHAIGRIGCLLSGCCYGMEYSGLLAVHYPHSLAGALPDRGYFPVQLVEAVCNVCICLVLLGYRKKATGKFELLSIYCVLYGLVRFSLEFLRGDAIRGIYWNISTSQWISLALLALGSCRLLCRKFVKKKKCAPRRSNRDPT